MGAAFWAALTWEDGMGLRGQEIGAAVCPTMPAKRGTAGNLKLPRQRPPQHLRIWYPAGRVPPQHHLPKQVVGLRGGEGAQLV